MLHFDGNIKALGHMDGLYYYEDMTGHVLALKPMQHISRNLKRLAPLDYWDINFPKKYGINWLLAASRLMEACARKGLYVSTAP
ncbi:MAG: hypothetical protein NUW09_11125 [Deltaproteobacteria bacterium]|nr:hypothetical protein [Deltaproteobacteria bacterium]